MRWTQENLDDFHRRVKNSPPGAVVLMPRGMRPSDMRPILPATPKAKKPAKYLNRKTIDLQGVVHDSKHEFDRWQVLLLRERAGEISDLRHHPRYDFCVNGVCVGRYTADASYVENGKVVVEDAKSKATRKIRDWPLRRNLMQALHGIQVREV